MMNKWLLQPLIVMMGLTSFPSSAKIFSYISKSEGVVWAADYTFHITLWDIEGNTPVTFCAVWDNCYISINHMHTLDGEGGNESGGQTHPYKRVNIRGLTTMREVQNKVFEEWGRPPYNGATRHRDPDQENIQHIQECVGIFYENDSVGSKRLLPGSMCGIAPPPIGACKIMETSIEVDYGPISDSSLQGATETTTFHVNCNQNLSVNVIFAGTGTDSTTSLRPNGSLKARLYLNDKLGEQGVVVNVPANAMVPVTLKSVLETSGKVESGDFSGSAALILTLP